MDQLFDFFPQERHYLSLKLSLSKDMITLFGVSEMNRWKILWTADQHSEYQAAHQRKEKIACSITLRDIITRIILFTERTILQRKDAAKGIFFNGHPTSRVRVSAHSSVQNHKLVSRFFWSKKNPSGYQEDQRYFS